MPVENLTGKHFNCWTVIRRGPNDASGSVFWYCKCDCGNPEERLVKGSNLRSGHSKSCGCLRKEKARLQGKANTKNLVGQKFGKLTVISQAPSQEKTMWNCICDCGNGPIQVSGTHLSSGHTKSCGCNISENLAGQIFGNLKVLKRSDCLGHPKDGSYWDCQCLCGNPEIIQKTTRALKNNVNLSCGCILLKSKGAEQIKNILNKNNIPYEMEKNLFTFEETNRPALFDFYVDNKYAIEFDGEQHFFYKQSGWNTKDHYDKTVKRDNIKTQWCKDHNIPLIRIPYTHADAIKLEDLLLESSKFIV